MTQHLTSIRLIIFDFDGTLGDTRRNIVVTMQNVMRELHLTVQDEKTCASTIGLPLRSCYKQMFPQLTKEELDECADTHRRLFAGNLNMITPLPFPHVREMLTKLKESGKTLSIASSRTSESLSDLLNRMELNGLFSLIIGVQEVKEAKPQPEPVLKTLATLGFHAEETLVIGDMDVDILMGVNAGVRTCGVTWGNGTREELERAGATFIVSRAEEILKVINSLERTNHNV